MCAVKVAIIARAEDEPFFFALILARNARPRIHTERYKGERGNEQQFINLMHLPSTRFARRCYYYARPSLSLHACNPHTHARARHHNTPLTCQPTMDLWQRATTWLFLSANDVGWWAKWEWIRDAFILSLARQRCKLDHIFAQPRPRTNRYSGCKRVSPQRSYLGGCINFLGFCSLYIVKV